MEAQRVANFDPGLIMLEMILRLHDVEIDTRQLRLDAGPDSMNPQTILLCIRRLGLRARVRRTNWKRLGKYSHPSIAMLRDGGFLLLGKVGGDKAVVLAPDGSRPSIVSRAEFESKWDGRLLHLVEDSALLRLRDRIQGFLALASPRRAAGRTILIVGNARKAAELRLKEVAARYKLPFGRMRELAKAGPNKLNDQARALVAGAAIIDFAERARKLQNSVVGPVDEARRRAQEMAFLPAALEIVETPPSPLGRATALSIGALFAVALAWSCLGTVDVVAMAPGKIVPDGGTKAVQPFEAGVVRAIKVHDGQIVKAGDVLIELDATMSGADLGRTKSDLLSAQLDAARLRAALAGGRDPQAAFHPPAGAPPELVEMHRSFLTSQIAEQDAKLSAIDRQITQKQDERTTIEATIAKLTAMLAPLQQKVDIRQQLVEKELASKLTYLTEYSELVERQQEITVQQSRHEEASAAVAALVETRAKTVAEYQRSLSADLVAAEQKSAGLAEDKVKAEQRTNLQTLRAPVDGMVQQLSIHTVGGVVTPAQTLMLVVPAGSGLEIEAMIPNRDVGFVEPGQDAAIKIDTFNFTRYGLLHGKLLSVSQDAVTPASQRPAGDRSTSSQESEPQGKELVYAARISMGRDYMDIDDKRLKLTAGMASTVEIRTGSRRIISYLLSPLMRYAHESLRER